jgi:hypothetical protein
MRAMLSSMAEGAVIFMGKVSIPDARILGKSHSKRLEPSVDSMSYLWSRYTLSLK